LTHDLRQLTRSEFAASTGAVAELSQSDQLWVAHTVPFVNRVDQNDTDTCFVIVAAWT